ncbi:TetR/AcrR family transcriptional regulator [Phenylobacterium sp.]|jgi:AcrR family transcriptional regulator|uniref:TetR/AcrR family transcriptional regulator n=1 Tax=Phenylobacterium sp. TaxID=1871053 RepID=UPI000C9232EE|nr:TetR/AcrR family transcriptional regulator [Phenylobacterium sp.]MAK81997.1 TetR family transcriptional regulator [Phenylobacterium sp.]|tara:strand:+ start:18055 stop:18654 length:600 start_codon:yes stop_codon:yes gene_type:complete
MPRVLTESDVADFRDRLCEVAEQLFAERGPEAVTMRQLASALGVSPMTPYRYFKDKDDILAAVRTAGFDRFAEALEVAYAQPGDARARGAAVGEAYVTFAFEHPQTYKLMFDMYQPNEADYPELARSANRARATMSQYVRSLVESGHLVGDPVRIGEMFWATTHGCIVLEMVGKLPPGGARKLIAEVIPAISRGLRPTA